MAPDDADAAPSPANSRVFDRGDAAASWQRGAASRALWLGPATAQMLDLAGVEDGGRVLAVAAGTGEEAIAAARRVGPGGSVLATDVSAAMLEIAATVAGELGLANVRTQTADAHDLGLEAGSFDAAICRLGLHFFSDLPRALAEIRRVLKPGSRLAAIVWSSPERTPFLSLFSSVVDRYRQAAGLPTTAPYRLGDHDVLANALRAAGFTAVGIHPVGHTRRFASTTEAIQTLLEEFPARNVAAAALPEADRTAALAEVEADYGRFAGPDGVTIPGEVLVAVGTR